MGNTSWNIGPEIARAGGRGSLHLTMGLVTESDARYWLLRNQLTQVKAAPCRPRRWAGFSRLETIVFRAGAESEKDIKLAQKSAQLQSFIAVFTYECMGQLASIGPP